MVKGIIEEVKSELERFTDNIKISSLKELPEVFRNRDIAITQYVYLSAIKEYMEKGGKSRGSYLVQHDVNDSSSNSSSNNNSVCINFSLDDGQLSEVINEIELKINDGKYNVILFWKLKRL